MGSKPKPIKLSASDQAELGRLVKKYGEALIVKQVQRVPLPRPGPRLGSEVLAELREDIEWIDYYAERLTLLQLAAAAGVDLKTYLKRPRAERADLRPGWRRIARGMKAKATRELWERRYKDQITWRAYEKRVENVRYKDARNERIIKAARAARDASAPLRRPGDGHQRSSGSNQACGPLPDVAADDIENQMDFADVARR